MCGDTILALATVALAFATFWLAIEARQSSYRQIGVQTWLELSKRFDSEEMKRARKALAKRIKTYDVTKHDKVSETVLNFFEDVGTLHKSGFLSKKMAGDTFSFHAYRWWEATKSYVDQERKRHNEDTSLFGDFEEIAALMRLPNEKIDATEVQQFLDDEMRLTTD